jgi:hypothetical protein
MPSNARTALSFWLLFAVFISLGLIFSTLTNSSRLDYIEIKPAFLNRAQSARERSWRSVKWQRGTTLVAPGSLLHDPFSVRLDVVGNLYILDFGDFSIKKFSPRGELVISFGGFKFRESEQLLSITDFSVNKQGDVWLCDPRARKLLVFSPSGQLTAVKTPLAAPYRILIDERDQLWLLSLDASDRSFLLQKSARLQSLSFGHIIQDQPANILAVDGWIANDGTGGMIYSPLNAGYLLAFNSKGEQRFAVRSIEPRAYPHIIQNTRGAKWVDRRSPPVVLGMDTAGREIYLLTKAKVRGQLKSAFDVYSDLDGSYRYSLESPEPCTAFAVRGDSVYIVNGTALTSWNRVYTLGRSRK